MSKDGLRYDRMVERALRGVVREAISYAATNGLPGNHHFYISFRTAAPGVEIGERLRAEHPDKMTIVLEHQFRDLKASEQSFAVTLSFGGRPQRLTIPFAAITAFADPSVKFELQIHDSSRGEDPSHAEAEHGERTPPKLVENKPGDDGKPGRGKTGATKPGEVVALDTFRKK